MKTIGFIDYYLGEWHALNYPAWIGEAAARMGLDYKLAYAWAEREDSLAYPDKTSSGYCAEFGVERCETIEELCEKSDVIVILAPTDPEKHLGYAEVALRYGKPTYIDKTFAPDLATAKEIFAIAERYGTPFFSSSALRYATELGAYENCRQMIVTGSGSNLAEYVIHHVEMAVKKLGVGAVALKAEQFGAQVYLHVQYPDDRTATLIFARSLPYSLYMADGRPDGARPVTVKVDSPFFAGLIEDMLRFFEEKIPSFDPKETLEVMAIREAAVRAASHLGEWIPVG